MKRRKKKLGTNELKGKVRVICVSNTNHLFCKSEKTAHLETA